MPSFAIWEEVMEFATKKDPASGKTYMQQLSKKMKDLGYSMAAIKANHGVFVDVSKERLWMIQAHESAGGMDAANWIVQCMDQFYKARAEVPPADIWAHVLDPCDPDEVERRAVHQAL